MRYLLLILLCTGLYGWFSDEVMGQHIGKLTVKESVEMGLEHNYRLRAARANVEEAEAAYRQSRASRLPVITGQARYMRLSDNIPEVEFTTPGMDTTFTLLPVELNQFHSELSIEQPLFNGGRRNNEIEAASRRAEAAGLMEKQEQANVAFEIRQAYWNLYHAQAAQETLESALGQVEEHVRQVRARVEEGAALRMDLLNAETRRSEVLLDQVEARHSIRVARLELNRLTGLPAEAEADLIEPGEPGTIPFEMDELRGNELEQRPVLQALLEQVKAQEADIQAIQSGWLPEINLVGRYVHARPNQYFFAEQDQFRGTWEAGVALRWRIWSGGQRVHEASQARARLKNTEAGLADRRDQVRVEITRHFLEMERFAEAIDVAAENIEAAEEAYRSTILQFDEGAALSEQVLDAEYAYRTAQARHTAAVADFEIARAAMLNALGQIWGESNEY